MIVPDVNLLVYAVFDGYPLHDRARDWLTDVLNGTERAALQDAESRFMRKIVVTPRKEYHLEQFDLQGK